MVSQHELLSQLGSGELDYDPIQLAYDMNWTISQLADILGVDQTTAYKWSSKKRNPNNSVRRLAGILKYQLSA
ncbi:MAG: helix-turn-helix transcriptional regulator [Okeania sp. SIO2C9]|uniref:helix-turn-helix transcriptional regulator n=1 Tax=Okeania sp. SIO2C9 TaxID=2607791 RepID=UPI0013C1B85D|nr:helix-turn-helix transcriptional regulator [Okeania sp. SIO2C9]NEQ78219.1 helix-turn-helix transcriptional regulator [Okeania sp. SIO2C9]